MSQKYVSKNLTIIVNTCDDYSDVLSIFFKSFEKWWPDCPYPIVITKNIFMILIDRII